MPALGVPWSSRSANFAGFTYHLPYFVAALNGLIVDGAQLMLPGGGGPAPAPGGGEGIPTGDGINEVAWVRGPMAGLTGLTSMLVDPTTGSIEECDILMRADIPLGVPRTVFNGLAGSYPGGWQGAPATGPMHTSAIVHEIGHFFGLDHTNLHPGQFGGTMPATPPPLGAAPTSLLTFTDWAQIPTMTSAVNSLGATAPGFAPIWWSALNVPAGAPYRNGDVHHDDIAGLCQLYPVAAPVGAASPVRPLINDFGRIEGHVLTGTPSSSPASYRNVFAMPYDSAAETWIPTTNQAALSSLFRLFPNEIVGFQDVVSTTPLVTRPGSGGFVLSMVLPNQEMALGVEPSASLAFAPGSEWWVDPLIPSSNFNPNPLPVTTAQSVMISAREWPNSVGSLYVAPGTVISLDINESVGAPALIQRDSVSRPLVQLSPRVGVAPGGVVTVTVVSDFSLSLANARWRINGVVYPAGPPTIGPTGSGPVTTTWAVAESTIGPGITSVGPGAVVRFEVIEVKPGAPAAVPPPPGTTVAFGVNECVF